VLLLTLLLLCLPPVRAVATVAVLLGPLRAINYCLMHGMLAAALGSCWKLALPWSVSVPLGAALRMGGQLAYLLLSSVTLNENLFAVIVANVHGLLVSAPCLCLLLRTLSGYCDDFSACWPTCMVCW
jgi:hypothetical protein